ncbi:hypothetical protein ENUP19_0159G0001 [Entamoeba nuttalli]|uniref:Uncharacterized protein n=1 Tax=Entamoeba nuttalli TaxID=412467 RepID=A0ABQ0DLE7_9EUKA
MSADSSDSNHSTWNIIRKIVMLILSCILLIVSCFFAFFESRRQGDVMNGSRRSIRSSKTLIPN